MVIMVLGTALFGYVFLFNPPIGSRRDTICSLLTFVLWGIGGSILLYWSYPGNQTCL